MAEEPTKSIHFLVLEPKYRCETHGEVRTWPITIQVPGEPDEKFCAFCFRDLLRAKCFKAEEIQ